MVRTGLEVVVVAIGLALGGVVGIGTVLYALSIGPLVQLMLPHFIVELPGHGSRRLVPRLLNHRGTSAGWR